jgi:hypothetical protein
MRVPHLADFQAYRIVDDVDLHGVAVTGLRAEFLRRGRTLACVYSYVGRTLFKAWGYAEEEHCRYHAVLGADGMWEEPQPGCPRMRVLQAGGRFLGIALRGRSGVWLVSEPPPATSAADGGSTGHLTAVGGPTVVPQSRANTTTVGAVAMAATALNG